MKRMRQATQTIGTVLPTHESHEENEAGTTDLPQFYIPKKVEKRPREVPQTIGTVLPTHESREENTASNTDHRYSFTYP